MAPTMLRTDRSASTAAIPAGMSKLSNSLDRDIFGFRDPVTQRVGVARAEYQGRVIPVLASTLAEEYTIV